jgi:hypothetical protein
MRRWMAAVRVAMDASKPSALRPPVLYLPE